MRGEPFSCAVVRGLKAWGDRDEKKGDAARGVWKGWAGECAGSSDKPDAPFRVVSAIGHRRQSQGSDERKAPRFFFKLLRLVFAGSGMKSETDP